MARFTYEVLCTTRNCTRPAQYKIAALWSDGITTELKTYGLVCGECLPEAFRASLRKQAACRRAPKEILERPGIYRLARGKRDVELERLFDLEDQLAADPGTTP
jgi:hypothetical protein